MQLFQMIKLALHYFNENQSNNRRRLRFDDLFESHPSQMATKKPYHFGQINERRGRANTLMSAFSVSLNGICVQSLNKF
jgi:hypothetical protein